MFPVGLDMAKNQETFTFPVISLLVFKVILLETGCKAPDTCNFQLLDQTGEDFWSLRCPLASSCKPPFPFDHVTAFHASPAVKHSDFPGKSSCYLTSVHRVWCDVCMRVAVCVTWDLHICR